MDNLAYNLDHFAVEKSGVMRLTLTDFRNYPFLRINTGTEPIVITGDNGAGKTNILEAISFLTPGRGLRGARLADLKRLAAQKDNSFGGSVSWAIAAKVSRGDDCFDIATAVEPLLREVGGEDDAQRHFERRIVKINGNKISSQAELGNYISAIWLTPQMDRLFRGGSQPRRSFLDRLVYDFDMEHAKRISSFEHLYKEWYRLLKEGRHDDFWLNGLEESMASAGVAIAAARREQIARLNTFIEHEPDDVFPSVRLELDGTIEKMLDTLPAIDVEDRYRGILRKMRPNVVYNDAIDGVNRTDFKVYYRKKEMPADLCSTGEQKSLLISIILAQSKCQSLYKGFAPILLLDEVVAHLDDLKREALIYKIQELNVQAWITATDADLFDSLRGKARFLRISDNQAFEE